MFSLRAPYAVSLARRAAPPDPPGGESLLVEGFWFFLIAAAVGGVAVWLWRGPVAGAATAWFISPVPPPPLSPI